MARTPQRKRCTGHSTRSGKRCKAWAIHGGTVCVVHGGQLPRVKHAAKRRRALAEADRMVQRADVDADPTEHLLDSLHQAAKLASIWGLMVAALDAAGEQEAAAHGTLRGELGYRTAAEDRDDLRVPSHDRLLALNNAGFAQVHPFMVKYELAIERRARLAKLCIDAGVAQKRVELEEQQGALIAQVFRAVFDDPELGLEAPQRRAAMIATARHLRLVAAPQPALIAAAPTGRSR